MTFGLDPRCTDPHSIATDRGSMLFTILDDSACMQRGGYKGAINTQWYTRLPSCIACVYVALACS